MPDNQSPPRHQSFWFPVAPESGDESSQGEPEPEFTASTVPPAPAPIPGLGWRAPRRVRVPLFERDAATENTTPAAPREPTANDETVRMLREHIVPPRLVDHDDEERGGPTAAECAARFLVSSVASAPPAADPDIVDASFDPDFQEVRREPVPERPCDAGLQEVVHFAPPDQITPPKGAESAQAPADPCGRDDATPNDGAVPQGIQISLEEDGQDDIFSFSCALWSNGTFSICPSEGGTLVLNKDDARELVRYVGEVLSARVRATA